MENKDIIIKGISNDGYIKFNAVNSKSTMITASKLHNLSLINKITFGRLLNAAILMSADLKNETDQLSLILETDGMIDKIVIVAYPNGDIKGYMTNPTQDIMPDKTTGKFNIKKALGKGYIKVIKELGLKTPYIGMVELKYGEIGEDIAYYFAQSEQIPTAISVGVLLNDKGDISQSGGYLIQLMPNTPQNIAETLERAIKRTPNFTDLLDMGYSIKKIMKDIILKDFELTFTQTKEIRYRCNCSKEKFSKGIILLGRDELQKAVEKNETLKAQCHFCNKVYEFTPIEIKDLIKKNFTEAK